MAHDYDPESDYEIDKKPPADVVKLVQHFLREHRQRGDILSKLKLKDVSVAFVKKFPGDAHLARFAGGTSSAPVILIDARKIVKSAKKYRLDLQDAVEPTLLHEYGHAWFESKLGDDRDLEHEEDIVEDFAHNFWQWRDPKEAIAILEKGLPA